MKNIIFLDIDGVLNDNSTPLSIESLESLKQLINYYNAQIVIISSRQQNGTANRRKRIKYQFEKLGIYNIDFIDPNFEGSMCDLKLPSRVLGIIDYLRNNEIANYVILDDDYHNAYIFVSGMSCIYCNDLPDSCLVGYVAGRNDYGFRTFENHNDTGHEYQYLWICNGVDIYVYYLRCY